MVIRCTLFLVLFSGRLLLAECKPQNLLKNVSQEAYLIARDGSGNKGTNASILNGADLSGIALEAPELQPYNQLANFDTTRHESGVMATNTVSYDDTNPSTLPDKDSPVISLVEFEKQFSGLDSLQRQDRHSIRINTVGRRSGFITKYKIKVDNIDPLTYLNSDTTRRALVELEHQSARLDTSQRQKNQGFGTQTTRRKPGSIYNYAISNDGTSDSTLNGTVLIGVTYVDLGRQPSGLDTPQGQENQFSGLDDAVHRSSSRTNSTTSRDHLHPLMFNGTDLIRISASMEPEQHSSGLDTRERQDNESPRFNMERSRSGSVTNYLTPNANPSKVGHTGLTTAFVGPEHGLVGLHYLQRNNGQWAAFDSTKKQAMRSSILDIAQNLQTRGAHPNPQGQLGSASNNPISALMQSVGSWRKQQAEGGRSYNVERAPRSQSQGGTKKTASDLAKSYSKLSRESLKRSLNKMHSSSRERMNKLISKCETISKLMTRTGRKEDIKSQSSLKGAKQKSRRWNFMQSVQSTGKKKREKLLLVDFTFVFESGGVEKKWKPQQGMQAVGQTTKRGIVVQKRPEWTDFEQECLDAHNEYRDRHGVPKLRLNRELCESSQRYANFLAATDPQHQMQHSRLGENLSATRGHEVTGRSAVDDWYAESNNYDFNTASAIDKTKEFAPFTVLIWQEITDMGVGYATSASNVTYVVCHYGPPGNDFTNFHLNVLPPLYGSNLHN